MDSGHNMSTGGAFLFGFQIRKKLMVHVAIYQKCMSELSYVKGGCAISRCLADGGLIYLA